MKSDGAIKTDVYRYINESGFMNNVNGKLSKTMRPHNSHKEDVVISILANEGTQFEENTIRVDEICKLAWNLLETFRTSEYAAHAIEQRVYATSTGEHVINNQVEYKLIND